VRESVFRKDLFAGKVAIVTGGATGIGLGIAEELARLGGKVMLASRKEQRLIPAAKGLSRDYGAEVDWCVVNIRDRDSVAALYDTTLQRFGSVDFVINNGGGQFLAPAQSIPPKGWNAVIETNLTGTWNMCQIGGEKWLYEHGGRIVNIVADMWCGFPGMIHTGAARAGVVNMTMTLAVEWASMGILINAVAPGIVLSTGAHNYPAGTMEAMDQTVPLKRLGSVQDVADSVAFLLSPAGDYITGATLRVDGGGSLWGDAWPISAPKEPHHYDIPPWPEDRWPEFAVAEKD